MMIKQTTSMTKTEAILQLEDTFQANYVGERTVRSFCTDLISAIHWENENPDDVYHCFDNNTIVGDDCLLSMAASYARQSV